MFWVKNNFIVNIVIEIRVKSNWIKNTRNRKIKWLRKRFSFGKLYLQRIRELEEWARLKVNNSRFH